VVGTIGLLVGLQGILIVRYGAFALPFESFLPTDVVRLPGVNVRLDQIIVTVLALFAAGGLYLFFRKARLGVAMEGVVDDPALLGLAGTSPVAVRRRAWMVGSCFAAASGLLLAPALGLDATVLTLLVVQAFGAAAVGAFNSLIGTYVGGLVIGVGASVATKLVSSHPSLVGLPPTLPFLVLFVVLLVLPRHRLIERGGRAAQRPAPPRSVPARLRVPGFVAGTLVLVALPHVVGGKLPVYSAALVYVVLFSSLGLLVRTSNQVSLCHMAFAAVGAATFAHAVDAGLPWLVAVLVGGLVAMPVGAIVAIPAIRLSGVFLAVATFGFGILVERIFYATSLMFGTSQRLVAPRPSLPGVDLGSDTGYYYVLVAVALCSAALVVVVRRSRLGRLLRALADSPTALAAHGTNTNLTRLFVFCVSAFLAGVAGAVAGPVTGSTTGGSFSFAVSLVLLAVMAIAGRQPVLSAFVAAALYVVIPSYIKNPALTGYVPVVFGLAAIAAAVGPLRRIVGRIAASARSREREGASPVVERMTAPPSGRQDRPALAGGTA
jgi:ABC-type branched-subunit amino acid transport system permease subunit